ncbi:thermonuclease family protein [Cyanobacteria bacterium FACHB-63]|nr:thermonuclease family protein [Cyanobacteria bacterium FACHB-63]
MKPKVWLIVLPIVAISGISLLAWAQSHLGISTEKQAISAPTTHHQIYRVVDARTIELENGEIVELCGVAPLQKNQKLETEAIKNLQELIAAADGKVIVAEHGRDNNNRITGEVFVPVPNSQEEKLLNYEQVRAGFAYENKKASNQCLNGSMLTDAQKLAQSERKGAWQNWDNRGQ